MKDLGNTDAVPVPLAEYERLREDAVASGRLARGAA
jgi:hypothetical protein